MITHIRFGCKYNNNLWHTPYKSDKISEYIAIKILRLAKTFYNVSISKSRHIHFHYRLFLPLRVNNLKIKQPDTACWHRSCSLHVATKEHLFTAKTRQKDGNNTAKEWDNHVTSSEHHWNFVGTSSGHHPVKQPSFSAQKKYFSASILRFHQFLTILFQINLHNSETCCTFAALFRKRIRFE